MTELDVGVLTQCLKFKTFKDITDFNNRSNQLITNILLKINAKLNGINHILAES